MKYGQKLTLKQHRQLAGMSQDELAEAIGVDRTAIWRWETGQSEPRYSSIAKMEEVLDIRWADDVSDANGVNRNDNNA